MAQRKLEGARLPIAELNPVVTADVAAGIAIAVRAALRQPAAVGCVPSGAVVLSMADPSVASLRDISLRRVAHLQCFMRRVVTLCLDGYTDSRGGTCVQAITQTHKAGSSQHRGENWNQLSWAKWPLLHVALSEGGAQMALFIDADNLLLRNPFSRMDAAQLVGPSFHHQEDCLSATDRLPAVGCEQPCRINTGFLLVTSASFCRGDFEAAASAQVDSAHAARPRCPPVGHEGLPKARAQRDQLQLASTGLCRALQRAARSAPARAWHQEDQ